MRKFIAFLLLLSLFLMTAVQVFAQAATPEVTPQATGVPPTLPDLLTLLQNDAQGRFTTLIAAIDTTEVQHLLSGGGPFTLLAPTNDAFTALETQTGMTQDQLLADRATLTKILLYHVVPGKYFFRQLTAGPTLPTELLGQSVTFDLTKGQFTVQGSHISDPDNLASNGIMHAIDAVILPPSVAAALATPEVTPAATEMVAAATEVATAAAPLATPEATAVPTEAATTEATPVAGVPPTLPDLLTTLQNDSQGRFTTLLAVIDAANLKNLLSGAGPFTLLAPTNDAFTALLTQTGMTQDQLLADTSTLSKILLEHIIRGKYFFRQLTSGPTLPTELLGQSVTFNLTKGVFSVEGANISDPDNLASNGIMHAIDAVILPPSVAAALATPEPTAEVTEVATAAVPLATPEATAAPTEAATTEATPVAGVPPTLPDLLTTLQNDSQGRFTTVLAVIDAANLKNLLSGAGPFTLLAPTNDAFTALLTQTGMTQDQLLADTSTLSKILLEHIIRGKYFFRQLTSGPTLPTELLGQSVTFNLTKGVFSVEGANISDPDNLASNGIMHAIDAVILPPSVAAALATPEATAQATEAATVAPTETPTPEATAAPTETPTPEVTQAVGVAPARPNLIALLQADAQGRFTTLLAALDAAGLTNTLSGGGPFTLLAPTNDAFTALETQTGMTQDQLLADTSTLTKILDYHVVPGQYFYRQLTAGPSLNTLLQDQQVTFGLAKGGHLTVQGAPISDADNLASNGIVDAIDAVILPPDVAAPLATPEPTPEVTATPTATPTPEATAAPTAEPTAVPTAAAAGGAHLRVAHFSPDAGAVDIYVNGTITSWTKVTFPTISGWMKLSAGKYAIGIALTGTSPTVTANVTLADGDWITVAVTGSLASKTLKATVLVESFAAVGSGNARLSVFNGVEGSHSYDVLVDGKAQVILLGYPGTQGGNDGFYIVEVPAGTHQIQFVNHTNHATVALDLPGIPMNAGTNYFVAAVGASASPGAVFSSDTVPTP